MDAATVGLRRWLRRQLRVSSPLREHLEAAIVHDDPGEVRRLLGQLQFTEGQRRHVDALIDAWERDQATGRADDR